MGDEELLAQILMFGWAGAEPSDLLNSWVIQRGLGSVKVFGWNTDNIQKVAKSVRILQQEAASRSLKIPLFVATDQEGGWIRHVKGETSDTPGNLAIGASGYPLDAYYSGFYINREIRALGINMNFAPTVDLYTNLNSSVIGPRSFGSDPVDSGILGENIFEKIHVTERKMAETQKNEIAAYADGVLIPIEEVDDDTFAQKVLGDGIAIIPENGNIYAPFDAEVVMVMDTGHAIGLMDKNNNEFLIHIGINTVNLNGKYFDVQAAVGDQVKMGDILVTEDIEKIKAEGYDMSVMIIATDANGRKIEKESPGKIKKGEKIAELV